MVTIYGIANCDTCRKARNWLEKNSIEYQFHDIRTDGLTVQQLERWCNRVGWEKVLNRRSLTWRKVPELDRENLTRSKAVSLMLEHPTLVRRPVFEAGTVTAVGFTDDGYAQMATRCKLTK